MPQSGPSANDALVFGLHPRTVRDAEEVLAADGATGARAPPLLPRQPQLLARECLGSFERARLEIVRG